MVSWNDAWKRYLPRGLVLGSWTPWSSWADVECCDSLTSCGLECVAWLTVEETCWSLVVPLSLGLESLLSWMVTCVMDWQSSLTLVVTCEMSLVTSASSLVTLELGLVAALTLGLGSVTSLTLRLGLVTSLTLRLGLVTFEPCEPASHVGWCARPWGLVTCWCAK